MNQYSEPQKLEIHKQSKKKIQTNQPTWAASEIKSKTKSLPEMVSHISPRVPFSSVKPAARASENEREPFLKPICIIKKHTEI